MIKGINIRNPRFVRTLSLFGLCFLFPFLSFSQGEFNNWYFGFHSGVTFNSGNPIALTNCAPYFSCQHVSSTVSDSTGSLLFYAGIYNYTGYLYGTIYNKNHQPMSNGQNLPTYWATHQNYLAVQKLDDDSSYYLFTMDGEYDPINYPNPKGLTYSSIDMRLNGGLGDIVAGQKAIQIPGAGQTRDMLSGTRHKNNCDVWITVRNYMNSYSYLTYLITSAGITPAPVVSNSLIKLVFQAIDPEPVMIRFSPDGTKLASLYSDTLEYCQFNSLTGQITPMFRIHDNGFYSSAEFSVNSKYLYVHRGVYIDQFDATKTDSAQFVQSRLLITSNTQMTSWLQRGPDNKIYVTDQASDSLGVIHNPNIQGTGCNYQRSAVPLAGNICLLGFPQFVQRYYLYMNHSGQCVGDSVNFSYLIWPPADSLYWNFGDPSSGSGNISHLIHPKHQFTIPGSYVITLIARHEDQRFDTVIQTISIKDKPSPNLGPDLMICQGDTAVLDAGAWPGCSFVWANLTTGQPNIGTGQTYTANQTGEYMVTVTSANGCTGMDTITLAASPVPALTNNPLSESICSGESTNIALTSTVPAATFSWTATLTSGNITGFSPDSGLVINQVLTDNLTTSGIVTYHITPKMGNCIGDTSDYQVTVNPGDSVLVTITSSANNICAGTLVNFTAIPTNGGVTPSYQWNVNGLNVGTNQPTYAYNPASGDLVSCILTSSLATCTSNNPAASDTITMIVNPVLPVSVSILPSANPVCAGTSVTFTATPTNGGSTPSYQWKINGMNVGSNSPVYTFIPNNGDNVSCTLTSSLVCVTNNPASSIQYPVSVNPLLPVSVTISASPNPVCAGLPVTFTATPVNGGTTPAYQWQVNGMNVGTNNPVYTYIPVTGDSIRCILTSNLPCTTNNPASGIWLHVSVIPSPAVTFTACFDTITTTNAKPIKLKGGIPLGGTYSGPGVLGGYFNPGLAGVGTHIITYSYTNAGLCTDFSISRIHEFTIPVFNCGSNWIDIRDGKSYPTIQLGGQCWFADDLNYGSPIPSTIHQRDNCTPEKYINPASSIQHPASNYQWDELMEYTQTPGEKGLCPPGWHVPTEAEWTILFSNWTNSAFAAAPLKYSGYSGFNALLNGANHLNWQWDYAGFATFYWSSDSHGPYRAWAHGMNDPDYSVSVYPSLRSNAFSVRCLRD
jgi:uncharacterized protein (TIGR02145 family)